MSAPLLGRREAAMLLAVERANGGELAGLEQVLAAFETLFDRQMEPDAYADASALLCEADLVEYTDESLGLTPSGRKLLRRTGVPGSPGRPLQVTEQLATLEPLDLAEAGSVASPDAKTLERAAAALNADADSGDEPVPGDDLAPVPPDNLSPWIAAPDFAQSRLVFPKLLHHHHGSPLPEVPLVQPEEADGPADNSS
ncbi:MAG: hypothetical protein ABSH30_15860 [Acidimicrobiales bacterium]